MGGYPTDTLAEDQDLTIAIQRAGWEVGYDIDAVAWTEAPETFRALAKQRGAQDNLGARTERVKGANGALSTCVIYPVTLA